MGRRIKVEPLDFPGRHGASFLCFCWNWPWGSVTGQRGGPAGKMLLLQVGGLSLDPWQPCEKLCMGAHASGPGSGGMVTGKRLGKHPASPSGFTSTHGNTWTFVHMTVNLSNGVDPTSMAPAGLYRKHLWASRLTAIFRNDCARMT